MRRVTVISGVLAATVVASAGGVVGLSAASSGKIAKGVHVGDVDLGGLTAAQAKDRLAAEYVAPLKRPIVVERRGKRFQLGPKEAKLTADLDETVASAVKESEEGNAITQAWRTATGSQLNKDLPLRITASDDAILRFVNRVRQGVDRAGKDATLTFVDDRPVVTKSTVGMKVDTSALRKRITASVTDPERKVIVPPVRTVQPKVTVSSLKKQHYKVLTVNRTTHTLRIFKNFKLEKSYSVAVGMQGLDTPAGQYTINDKQENPSWHVPMSAWAGSLAGTVVPPGPSNPIKARWMGFFDGAGIHGTSDDASIGSNASHGCVRMHVSDVIDLYPRVPIGTTINVV
jgi:lipoprotein-anchoring transpeptidase ErfK/SrfK